MAFEQSMRRNFLINKKFQLSFLLIAVLFMGLMSVAIGLVLPWLFQGDANKFLLVMTIISITIIFSVLCIAFTHSVAGPIYQLGNVMRQVTEGGVVPDITFKFRDTDNFKWLAEDFNSLLVIMRGIQVEKEKILLNLENLKTRIQKEQLSTDQCVEALDKTIMFINDTP